VQSKFRYLEPLRRGSQVRQTDGRTDGLYRSKCHDELRCELAKSALKDNGNERNSSHISVKRIDNEVSTLSVYILCMVQLGCHFLLISLLRDTL